jgi:hypothetical protein
MKVLMMAPIYGFILWAILFTPWPTSDELFNPLSKEQMDALTTRDYTSMRTN